MLCISFIAYFLVLNGLVAIEKCWVEWLGNQTTAESVMVGKKDYFFFPFSSDMCWKQTQTNSEEIPQVWRGNWYP